MLLQNDEFFNEQIYYDFFDKIPQTTFTGFD